MRKEQNQVGRCAGKEFRDSPEELRFPTDPRSTIDGDGAARAAIDTLNLIGLGVLCEGRAAFMNCTRPMLLMGYFSLLRSSEESQAGSRLSGSSFLQECKLRAAISSLVL